MAISSAPVGFYGVRDSLRGRTTSVNRCQQGAAIPVTNRHFSATALAALVPLDPAGGAMSDREMRARDTRRAIRLYKCEAVTLEEIVRILDLDISPKALQSRMRTLGVKLREAGWTQKLTDAERDRVLRLSAGGSTVAEIAELVGIARSTVSRIRSIAGFEPLRSGGTTSPTRKVRWYAGGKLIAKWCPTCQKKRRLAYWYKNAHAADGLQSRCTTCATESRRAKLVESKGGEA